MKKLWICLAVLAISANVAFAYDSDEQDDWQNYESYEDNGDLIDGNSYELKDLDEFDLVENITNIKKSESNFDIGDYQVEDNRSQLNEDISDDMTDDLHLRNENIAKEKKESSSTEFNNLAVDVNNFDNDENNILPKSITYKYSDKKHSDTPEQTSVTVEQKNFEFDKKIFEDTKSILNEDNHYEFAQSVELDNENVSDDLNELIEQTRRLLDETQDTIIEDEYNDSGDNKNGSHIHYDESLTKKTTKEDTTSQAIEDLIADLDRFKETWSKLNDEWNLETSEKSDEIEDKSIDKNSESLLYRNKMMDKEINMSKPILYVNDALPASDANANDETESGLFSTQSTITEGELTEKTVLLNIPPASQNILGDLGVSSTIEPKISNQFETISSKPVTLEIDVTENIEPNDLTPTTENFSNMNVDELMKNFRSLYEITQIKENDVRNATKIWLTTQMSTEITSPDYPNPYPTNTVTDWMFTAVGMGIELNITDFDINGSAGDYVLVKPGGVDESGSSGLLFSYHLDTERRFRFMSVDKMFVRFHAKPGERSSRGFRFSIRAVVPLRALPVPEPEPERVIPAPTETITLNLGGVSLEDFLKIEERFRQILAEMATMYISSVGIDPGLNTTLEVTQITSRALCFHNWPKFQQCAEVRFGVPLIYDDEVEREPRLNVEDLTVMWNTYSQVDTIAKQLRELGITEFQVPNDRGVMIVWLIIAGGVVISMAMLAFALWRFSCFEDYTRMPTFNDTDSVKEKRNLDLYPTPHQTLPPLYTETDYEWADAKYDDCAKVDVGGYSNKSYVPENPYDLDSDEDIVPASARNTSFTPRDIYNV